MAGLLGHISREDRDSGILSCFLGTCKVFLCPCKDKDVDDAEMDEAPDCNPGLTEFESPHRLKEEARNG